jgi:glycosyltransferase involved in cell wall biosynthesis
MTSPAESDQPTVGGRVKHVMLSTPTWPAERESNGVATYVSLHAAALRQLGVDPVIFTRNMHGPDEPNVYTLGMYQRNPGWGNRLLDLIGSRCSPATWMRFRDIVPLRRSLHDAIARHHVQLLETEEVWGAAYQLRHVGVPIVTRLHGPWFLVGEATNVKRDALFRHRVRLEGRGLEAAAGVTAPSHAVLQRVREHYGLPLPNAVVIPNPTRSVPAPERWKLEESDPTTILFIGRFDRVKGADLLLAAFARLAAEHREVVLQFVGPDKGLIDDAGRTWSIGEYLHEHLRDEQVRSRVQVLGFKTPAEIRQLRRRARVAVVTSRFETFCLAVVEAMAMGQPVVAGNVGGIGEIIEHDRNGVLCDPTKPDDLAAALHRVLSDDALAKRIGAAGAVDVEKRYNPVTLAKQTLAFYERWV